MSDKDILDEVYRRLCFIEDNWDKMNMDRMFDKIHDMKDMIEEEWQNADLGELAQDLEYVPPTDPNEPF
tara:strand:+ start:487 stop:693 length:207 start_codon:yes stop_codon:yes gene_type:complete